MNEEKNLFIKPFTGEFKGATFTLSDDLLIINAHESGVCVALDRQFMLNHVPASDYPSQKEESAMYRIDPTLVFVKNSNQGAGTD